MGKSWQPPERSHATTAEKRKRNDSDGDGEYKDNGNRKGSKGKRRVVSRDEDDALAEAAAAKASKRTKPQPGKQSGGHTKPKGGKIDLENEESIPRGRENRLIEDNKEEDCSLDSKSLPHPPIQQPGKHSGPEAAPRQTRQQTANASNTKPIPQGDLFINAASLLDRVRAEEQCLSKLKEYVECLEYQTKAHRKALSGTPIRNANSYHLNFEIVSCVCS